MNNKNTLLTLLVIFVVSVAVRDALAVNVRNIAENSDGISSKIDASKLKGLEDWLYNLKLDIQRDVTQLEKAEVGDKEAMLSSVLQRALKSAGSGTEEFLTRNILIRGIEVYNEMLAKDMGSDNEPKRSAFARRFLELHLRWAGELAPLDKKLLETLKDPYKISETEQRVEIGMEWAQKMVAISFSLPTNEAHYKFLMKTMGYLFNDIVNDDRYNRKLASTARVFVEKYQEQQSKNIQSPLEYLDEAKDFREFLLDEFNVLGSSTSLLSTDESGLATSQGDPSNTTIIEALKKNLKSSNVVARESAIELLDTIKEDRVTHLLILQLNDANYTLREKVYELLLKREINISCTPYLQLQFTLSEWSNRRRVVALLSRIPGQKVTEILIGYMNDPDYRVVFAVNTELYRRSEFTLKK